MSGQQSSTSTQLLVLNEKRLNQAEREKMIHHQKEQQLSVCELKGVVVTNDRCHQEHPKEETDEGQPTVISLTENTSNLSRQHTDKGQEPSDVSTKQNVDHDDARTKQVNTKKEVKEGPLAVLEKDKIHEEDIIVLEQEESSSDSNAPQQGQGDSTTTTSENCFIFIEGLPKTLKTVIGSAGNVNTEVSELLKQKIQDLRANFAKIVQNHSQSKFNKIQYFQLPKDPSSPEYNFQNLDGTKSTRETRDGLPDWVTENPLYQAILPFAKYSNAKVEHETNVIYFVFTRSGLVYVGQTRFGIIGRFKGPGSHSDFSHVKLMEMAKLRIWQTVSDFVLGMMSPEDIYVTSITVVTYFPPEPCGEDSDGEILLENQGFYSTLINGCNDEILQSFQNQDDESARLLVERLFIGYCHASYIPSLNLQKGSEKTQKISDNDCKYIIEKLSNA
ncbi:hypothetical protein FDP41_004696 [Naegleria fowleri]|uniref:Uncharacterized protein n=1 Tax=Naegleria fowleri TaxID=5763 RepID=A0A6A5BQ48_NAEFO|nr:uncharacterized protein FDP41_004696 [Naegleria fowleri]KAF0976020.1 hypothetical protein FDP41_004696 [Naegleria fowleri]